MAIETLEQSASGILESDKKGALIYDRDDSENSNGHRYGIFAEQFLERPAYIPKERKAGFTVTVCTWRGVPTVDDW